METLLWCELCCTESVNTETGICENEKCGEKHIVVDCSRCGSAFISSTEDAIFCEHCWEDIDAM